jgi:hypothetical protein
MSGRGMTAETRYRNKPQGSYTRLKSTPMVAAAAISSAFTWLIDLYCRDCRKRTSLQLLSAVESKPAT